MGNETPLKANDSSATGRESATGSDTGRNALIAFPDRRGNVVPKKFHFGKFASQTFRGRYFILIVLGLITGAGSGYLGWRFTKPIYHSEGLVRIAYELPAIISKTDQNEPMQMFDTFMQSQKMLITSRRTIDKAVQDPIWAAMNRPIPPAPDKYFADNLLVDIKGRNEFIRIVVSDYDPGTAAAAATSIVNAYVYQYKERENQLKRERFGKLEDKKGDLQRKVKEIEGNIAVIASEYGTTKLDIFYEAQFAKVGKIKSMLSELRGAIATAQPAKTPATNPTEKKSESKEMTLAQISAFDPATRAYRADQDRLEEELDRLMNEQGLMKEHPSVEAIKKKIEAAKKRVAKAAADYREIRAIMGTNGPDLQSTSITAGKSLEVMQANITSLEALLKSNNDEMVRIGTNQRSADALEAQLISMRADLVKLTDRLNSLDTEDRSAGRLELYSTGEIPLSPDRDPRIRLAAATGIAGIALPFGLLLLSGFVSRKFRYSDEMESDPVAGSAPLLGILPELNENASDRDEMLAAAHSIHQVRVSLQARSGKGPQTYLITSAVAGEGKTSLTLSLGLSFAVSKQRTLVIDADLVGRHLTAKLDLQGMAGLHEALETGRIDSLLQKTDDGLFVLTAGRAAAQHAYAMPATKFRALLDEAQKHFDVILIDTGPILGSVEAAVLAQEVDGVIFAIARGQRQRMVSQAMGRLNALNVRVVGLIFNRAKPEDFRRSPYGSSYRSMSVPFAPETTKTRIDGLNAFGPLVNAVDAKKPKERV